jgi:hypothetical protein
MALEKSFVPESPLALAKPARMAPGMRAVTVMPVVETSKTLPLPRSTKSGRKSLQRMVEPRR